MLTRCLLSLALVLSAASSVFAQGAWQFHWQKGQTLTYKIKHVTSVVEIVGKPRRHAILARSRQSLAGRRS